MTQEPHPVAGLDPRDGFTLAHLACAEGRPLALLQAALSREPESLRALTIDGETVLHIAARQGDAAAVAELLRRHELKVPYSGVALRKGVPEIAANVKTVSARRRRRRRQPAAGEENFTVSAVSDASFGFRTSFRAAPWPL